jgi:hypothetical protein
MVLMFGIYAKSIAQEWRRRRNRHHSPERKRNYVVWEVGDTIYK